MRDIYIGGFSGTAEMEKDVCIVFFDRKDYLKVTDAYKDYKPQYEHWYNIRISDTFYEVMVFSKEDSIYYNPMLSLRTVLTPFVMNGQPRGWFYDENSKPVRFTGIGNSLYFNSPNDNGEVSWECYRLFNDMYVQDGDNVSTDLKNTSPFNEKALSSYNYRFCPLENQEERERGFSELRSDKRFRFGAIIN